MMRTDTPAVQTQRLVKNFGDTAAVDGVDLSIPRSGIYGVLGPNGAGKTTVIRMLEAFGLTTAANRPVKKYSGGMRRRLDIAGSLIVTPGLMFLDEPTTGIDPRSRNQAWDIIRTLVDGGTTVLLTTQYLEEADQLADRIAVIDHGTVVAEGTPGQLKAEVGSGTLRVRVHDVTQRDKAAELLRQASGTAVTREADPASVTVQIPHSTRVTEMLNVLEDAAIDVAGFSYGQPSLDEVFLTLTGTPTTPQPETTLEAGSQHDE